MNNSGSSLPELIKSPEGTYTVFYEKLFLYHDKKPYEHADNRIKNIILKPESLIIIPSPLLFYGLPEIIKKLPDTSHIIAVENDINLFNLRESSASIYNDLEIKIEYFLFSHPENIIDVVEKLLDKKNIRKVTLVPLNNAYYKKRHFYTGILSAAEECLKNYYKNKLTLMALGSRWYKNIFLNIPHYLDSRDISELKINRPVVVAGAGASLESAVDFIINNRKSFTLIAIDTALGTLLGHNITPDYIAVMESQVYNIFDFHGYNNSDIPLIADITSYPQTFNIFKGEKYFYTSHFDKSGFLEKYKAENLLPSFIPPLGSVGITAVYIASIITDSPVFYCGLDFCFIPGKSHSVNTPLMIYQLLCYSRFIPDHNYSLCCRHSLKKTKDNKNLLTYTNIVLESYAKTLSEISDKNRNTFALFKAGIARNKCIIKNEKDFFDVITNYDSCKTQRSGLEQISKADMNYAEIVFDSELTEIQLYLELFLSYLKGDIKNIDCSIVEIIKKEYDYLLADFMNHKSDELLYPSSVKSIIINIYKYIRIIKKAKNIIRHLS